MTSDATRRCDVGGSRTPQAFWRRGVQPTQLSRPRDDIRRFAQSQKLLITALFCLTTAPILGQSQRDKEIAARFVIVPKGCISSLWPLNGDGRKARKNTAWRQQQPATKATDARFGVDSRRDRLGGLSAHEAGLVCQRRQRTHQRCAQSARRATDAAVRALGTRRGAYLDCLNQPDNVSTHASTRGAELHLAGAALSTAVS